METKDFSSRLIHWYNINKRDLPWRNTNDPYKIWLSEIILQQTRVTQGLPYYLKFVEKFPDVYSLAKASENEVLREWQGLGYYSRARNLHTCSKEICALHEGKFPQSFEKLKELKGIGPYTAAAIASFSFKEAVAVADGNVQRVLARVFGIEQAVNSTPGVHAINTLAQKLLPLDKPDVHNQAVMEFGAIQCTPNNPNCMDCVFNDCCFAFMEKKQDYFPVKIKNKEKKIRYFNYFVLKNKNEILMRKRPGNDIWQGLYDFYLLESKDLLSFNDHLGNGIPDDIKENLKKTFRSYKHILTHQVIFASFFECIVEEKEKFITLAANLNMEVYKISDTNKLPKPILIDNYLKEKK